MFSLSKLPSIIKMFDGFLGSCIRSIFLHIRSHQYSTFYTYTRSHQYSIFISILRCVRNFYAVSSLYVRFQLSRY